MQLGLSNLWALLWICFSWSAHAQEAAWISIERQPGFEVFERKVPGSDIIAFRGIGLMNHPVRQVATLILDRSNRPEWVPELGKVTLLSGTPLEFLEYSHLKTPFVIKDRDFVTRIKIKLLEESRSILITNQAAGPEVSAPSSHYIRGEIREARFLIEPGPTEGTTRLTAEMHVDPKGSVPKWIVNLFQRDWPKMTFQRLRNYAQRMKQEEPQEFTEILGKLGPSWLQKRTLSSNP
jgi:hypothetical protein